MSAIIENTYYKALEQLLESQFDPKSKQMRDFKDALMKSSISTMFFTMPGASAKVVKQEEKQEKKTKKSKKTDENGAPKEKRAPNAYMLFLADKREEIKKYLMEEQPELKGKELQNAITKKAGEIWKLASDEEKKPYTDKVAEAKAKKNEETKPVVVEEETTLEASQDEEPAAGEKPSEEEETGRTFNAEFNVWVDDETKLYYEDNNEDSAPMGQILNGKMTPFKKSKK